MKQLEGIVLWLAVCWRQGRAFQMVFSAEGWSLGMLSVSPFFTVLFPISPMTAGIFHSFALHLFCVNNQQKLKHDEENLSYYCGSDIAGVGCWSIMYGWLARQVAQPVCTDLVAESESKSSLICRWIKGCNSIALLKARMWPISKCGWMVLVGCFQRLCSFCFYNLRKGRTFWVPLGTFT